MECIHNFGDPLEMSLDDIIRLKRSFAGSRPASVAGSVKSYRSNHSNHSNRSNRSQWSKQSKRWKTSLPGGRQYYGQRKNFYTQRRPTNLNHILARQSVRRAARFLNAYPNSGQRMYHPYMYVKRMYPRQQAGYVMRRPLLGVFGPNINRIQRFQGIQQRANRVGVARSRQSSHVMDPEGLTVNVVNDLFQQPELEDLPPLVESGGSSRGLPPLIDLSESSQGLPPLIDNSRSGRRRASSAQRNIGRLNQANVARHNAAMGAVTTRTMSPSGSVRTTVSTKSRSARRRENKRRRAQELNQALLMGVQLNGVASTSQQHRRANPAGVQPSTSRHGQLRRRPNPAGIQRRQARVMHQRLNPAIQMAIASLQSKGISNAVPIDSEIDRPTPFVTAVTLNSRFTP